MSELCNQKVKELTTDRKNGFSFKVKKNEELNQLSVMQEFEDFSCEFFFQKISNKNEGIIYIHKLRIQWRIKKKS